MDNPFLIAAKINSVDLFKSLEQYTITPEIDINQPDATSQTALSYALNSPEFIKAGIVTKLLDLGANVDVKIEDKSTRTYDYVKREYVYNLKHVSEVAVKLPEPIGINILNRLSVENLKQITASKCLLHTACDSSIWAVKYLIEKKLVDVNLYNKDRGFPITSTSNINILNELLKAGAKVCIEVDGVSPIEIIFSNNRTFDPVYYETILNTAKKEFDSAAAKGKKIPPFIQKALGNALLNSVRERDKSKTLLIWKILGKKTAVISKSKTNKNMLQVAIESNQIALAKKLFNAGNDVNHFSDDETNSVSAFLTLPYERAYEKDRNGDKRADFWKLINDSIKWDQENNNGKTLAEILWEKEIIVRGNGTPNLYDISKKLWQSPSWNPIKQYQNGNCFLIEATIITMSKHHLDYKSPAGNDQWGMPYLKMLFSSIERSDFTSELAQKMAETIFSENTIAENFWNERHWGREEFFKKSTLIAKLLKDKGANFSEFKKAKSLIKTPELNAWMETEELSFLNTINLQKTKSRHL